MCLAVWLTFSARSTTDRILAVVPPIAAFVAAGFEHSIANMDFIPVPLFAKADAAWFGALNDTPDVSSLTWRSLFADNLLPVTIGNLVGGTLMVGLVYWLIYLRPSRRPPETGV